MRYWGLIVGALAGVGCAVPSAELEPGEVYRLEMGPEWTPAERAEMTSACDEWRSFTSGRLACVVVPAAGDVQISRAATGSGGTYSRWVRLERRFVVDADRLSADGWELREGLGAAFRAGLGVGAGMPLHEDVGVLSAVDVRPEFTIADLESCRRVRFCE